MPQKNKGKVESLKNVLSQYGIEVIQVPLDLPELQTDNLHEIAKEKVLFAYKKIKKPVIALDSGFYIYSLNDFPKTFVNFVLETIGIDGILKLVKNKNRKCEFRNCLAYYNGKIKKPIYFESIVKRRLSQNQREKCEIIIGQNYF